MFICADIPSTDFGLRVCGGEFCFWVWVCRFVPYVVDWIVDAGDTLGLGCNVDTLASACFFGFSVFGFVVFSFRGCLGFSICFCIVLLF